MNLVQWPEEYDKRIQVRIFDGLGSIPAAWRDYFNITPTVNFIEYTTGYSGFGPVGQWPDGTDLPIDEAAPVFDNTLTQVFYGMGFKVTRKHLQYGQLRLIQRWADSLARSLAQTYATAHATVLGNAFTTTYASLGTVALISASHAGSGGVTRSNILASSALTPANLETLIVQGQNTVNYRGLNDPIFFSKLIVPPALRRTAAKVLGVSVDGNMAQEIVGLLRQESGTANNDINTQLAMFRVLVEPMLTSFSSTAYYLQGETHGLLSLHGMEPQPKRYEEESSESLVHGVAADFVPGVEFWEGMCGSQGA